MLEPIEISVVVRATPVAAFAAFTREMDRWWPKVPVSLTQGTLHMEAGRGGRILEVAEDGTVHVWGHVTAWEPPRRIALKWYVGRDAATATNVEVRFVATDDGRCGLTLVQSGWEALGDQAGPMRERNVGGWMRILADGFAGHLARKSERISDE